MKLEYQAQILRQVLGWYEIIFDTNLETDICEITQEKYSKNL